MGQYYEMGFQGPKQNCGICGLPFYKNQELTLHNGQWVCEQCYDEPRRYDQ